MTFQITGKNIDIGEALKAHILERLDHALDKYVSTPLSGHIRIEKERGNFLIDCSIQLESGLILHSHGESPDAYASADTAFEKLEKRLRRYKRRLKSHSSRHNQSLKEIGIQAYDYVLKPEDETSVENQHEEELAPVIVAETQIKIDECSVGDAVMKMDLSNKSFIIFKNASNGAMNVVYKRDDGHIGWVDPTHNAT
ncbi:MAG: ribosome-associated translation inhibitor RaiA [Pseudomonadota bacterium]